MLIKGEFVVSDMYRGDKSTWLTLADVSGTGGIAKIIVDGDPALQPGQMVLLEGPMKVSPGKNGQQLTYTGVIKARAA